jgi:hypothetical protein
MLLHENPYYLLQNNLPQNKCLLHLTQAKLPLPNSSLYSLVPDGNFESKTNNNQMNYSLIKKIKIMKKLNYLTIVMAILMLSATVYAQNIAISDVAHTADASAVLDVYSTSMGFLVPRMATAPSTPANGLIYFNTTTNSFFYNAGTSGTPNWTELSQGNLWSRNGTDTYLTNLTDNVVIGTNTSFPGYKFYVHSPTSQMSRFDGQVEFWATAAGNMYADVNTTGPGHGVFNLYDNTGTKRIELNAAGNSLFNGGAVCIGGALPTSLLHIVDNNGFGTPQLLLDNISGVANTAVGYQFGGINYTHGIEPSTGNFVLSNAPVLNPAMQGDGVSMMNIFPNGITDLNNQSRSRAFQTIPTIPPFGGQIIPFGSWTPVIFDMISYDQHAEFTPGTIPGSSFFTATEDGFYQVNSRIDFILIEDQGTEIHYPNYPGYVSIAIFKHDQQGNVIMYAQGNKLQGADNNNFGEWNDLRNNLAPNISDVVELKKGEKIEIRAYQSLWNNGIPLRIINLDDPGNPGIPDSQVYVSVHKSS